jgi:predicted ester cyclase
MSVEENKATLKKYIEEILNNQNFGVEDKYVAADFIGRGGQVVGREGHRQHVTFLHSGSSDIRYSADRLIGEGDTVVAVGNWSGTFDREWSGNKPNGKKFKFDVVGIYDFKDGMVVRGTIVSSMLAGYQQLGILPPGFENLLKK